MKRIPLEEAHETEVKRQKVAASFIKVRDFWYNEVYINLNYVVSAQEYWLTDKDVSPKEIPYVELRFLNDKQKVASVMLSVKVAESIGFVFSK